MNDYQWTVICAWCRNKEQRVKVVSVEDMWDVLAKANWEYLSGEWLCPDCATEYWLALEESTLGEV